MEKKRDRTLARSIINEHPFRKFEITINQINYKQTVKDALMETKSNKIDFTNQIISAGIDVHKKNWSVTLSTNKIILKTFSMDPSAQQLVNYLRKNYPGGKYKSVYEAGFCGFGIHNQLEDLGIENIIVNPADIPTKNKERRNRNDRIDSRKLVRELENGTLTGIYIPTDKQQELRSMNRLRYQLVKDQARMKNRIKGFLLYYGKKIPENYEMVHWSGNFIKYLEELDFTTSIGKEILKEYLTELKEKKVRISKIIKSLRKSVKEYGLEEIIKRLSSIPGIGFLSAVTLLVELIDINRFKKTDELCSYVGLIPSVDSSGQKEKVLGLNGRHNKYLRNLLIESAYSGKKRSGSDFTI